ncbi:helix-turn-helix transcriptional regulator [Candidatus Dojkabacteria bacterium]|nr:helix-turn-helix transcriptional regulator [Candidatus Dojkabacteria bacterium]
MARITNNSDVGHLIKFYRERKHMTQIRLENLTALGSGTVAKIENGTRRPKRETIVSIAQTLQLNAKETAHLLGINLYAR